MAKAPKNPKDPNRPKAKTDAPAPPTCECVPPTGFTFVPVGTRQGDQLIWDANLMQYVVFHLPETPNGEPQSAGADGPFWKNVP